MELKTIKLIAEWESDEESYKSGQVLEVDPTTYAQLIADEVAEDYVEEKVEEQIVKAVKQELSEARSEAREKAPAVAIDHEVEDKWHLSGLGEFALGVRDFGRKQSEPAKKLAAALSKDASVMSETGWEVPLGLKAGMTGTADSTGGYLRPKPVEPGIEDPAIMGTLGLAQRCRQVPMTSNRVGINAWTHSSRADGSRYGGANVYWLDEGASITESNPTIKQVELQLHKVAGFLTVTDELLEDIAALEFELNRVYTQEIETVIEGKIVRGDGVAKPLGILDAPCAIGASRESATHVSAEDFTEMYTKLWGPSHGNAVWLVHQSVMEELLVLTLSGTVSGITTVFMPAGMIAGRPFSTLFGQPMLISEDCSELGTKGDVILADFSQYLYAQKAGVDMASSIHLYFDYAKTAYRFIKRVDGRPLWPTTVTAKNGTQEYSPFIHLAT